MRPDFSAARVGDDSAVVVYAGSAVRGDHRYRALFNSTYVREHGEWRLALRQVVGRWKDEDDLKARAGKLLRELRLQALLGTRSEEGMTLFRDGEAIHEPAQAREVYDVSGAGDTVIATLAVMLASGQGLAAAMKLANRAAGVVVGKLGTATCSLEELRTN